MADSRRGESIRERLTLLAREVAGGKPFNPAGFDGEDISTLLHELGVHQAELEAQNEELRQAKAELEEARDRYADLYHQARWAT
jgi:hypothetical protein